MTYHVPLLLFNIISYLSGRINISAHADKIVFSRIFFSSRHQWPCGSNGEGAYETQSKIIASLSRVRTAIPSESWEGLRLFLFPKDRNACVTPSPERLLGHGHSSFYPLKVPKFSWGANVAIDTVEFGVLALLATLEKSTMLSVLGMNRSCLRVKVAPSPR